MDLSPLDPVFCLGRLRGLLGLVSNTSLLRDMQDHFTEGWPFLSARVATNNSFRDFPSRIFRSKRLTQAYLIFVICFTRAKFLENKIYTEKTRKLRQNTQ